MSKSWNKNNKEEQAAIICGTSLGLGLIFVLLGAIFHSPTLNIFACLAGFAWAYGCLKMCIATRKLPEWQGRMSICGAFAMFGLLVLEVVVDFIAENFFKIELPTVTLWYLIPCALAFFVGLIGCAINRAKEKKEIERLFTRR